MEIIKNGSEKYLYMNYNSVTKILCSSSDLIITHPLTGILGAPGNIS